MRVNAEEMSPKGGTNTLLSEINFQLQSQLSDQLVR